MFYKHLHVLWTEKELSKGIPFDKLVSGQHIPSRIAAKIALVILSKAKNLCFSEPKTLRFQLRVTTKVNFVTTLTVQ